MRLAGNQNIYSYAAAGKVETSVNWILFRKNGDFTPISEHTLNNVYLDFFKTELIPVFNSVITNLKKQKEHLALQLDFEFGNISEEAYSGREAMYLIEPEEIPARKLKQNINILFTFSNIVMDAEEISEAFNCRLETAEDALQMLLFKDEPDAGI
jgi:hypothetical protein